MNTIQSLPQTLPVLHIGDRTLNMRSAPVADPTNPSLRDLLLQMFQTMHIEKGCGLAAPQVGVLSRIITIDLDQKQFTMINPEITKTSDEMILFTEGCLSVPGRDLPIIRHRDVTVAYCDEYGKKHTLDANGVLAIACQHEIDHLDGILITDRFAHQKALRDHFNITL